MKSIIQFDKRFCYICEEADKKIVPAVHEHHVFGGPNRKLSERYGLKIYLCLDHHTTGKHAVHKDEDVAEWIHKIGQMAFEETNSREEFRKVFGKSYL